MNKINLSTYSAPGGLTETREVTSHGKSSKSLMCTSRPSSMETKFFPQSRFELCSFGLVAPKKRDLDIWGASLDKIIYFNVIICSYINNNIIILLIN